MQNITVRPRHATLLLFVILMLAGVGVSHAAAEDVIVPIVFPVGGACEFTDTFGASRGGGTRSHEGIDILADKMTPVLAAVDGSVRWLNDGEQTSTANGLPYYNLLLKGDDGNDYYYIHLNNDTPGTDDGVGGPENAYAPGIENGVRVTAGQHIAYVGDSGNAEDTGSHLHFEIHLGGYKNPVNAYPSLVAAKAGLFKDVRTGDWCFQYINTLVKKGVVNGYNDGTFRPESLVSRAEFIKMVVAAKGMPLPGTFNGYFPDVSSVHWVAPYVEAARDAGIVDGDTSGTFRPDAPVNRAEAAKIVVNASGAGEGSAEAAFSDVSSEFWAFAPIMAARASGIISGYPDGTYRPLNQTNRAESSKIICTLCD